jgi:hypothetical protein
VKTLNFALYICLTLGFISCKYHCPGYPDSELLWIPYNIGDTLIYRDELDTIIMPVIDHFLSPPSSFRGIAMDIECSYNGFYQTSKVDIGYQIREEFKNEYDWGMYIKITQNDSFHIDAYNKRSFSNTVKVKYIPDTIINSVNYSEVLLVSKDTLKSSPRIAWFLRSNEKGIIEFYDYRLKRKWRLIN